MSSSHLFGYPLIILAILVAGAGIAADTGASETTGLPDLPATSAIILPSAASSEPQASSVPDESQAQGEAEASTPGAFAGFPAPGKSATATAAPVYRYFPALFNPGIAAAHPAAQALMADSAETLDPSIPVTSPDIPLLANNQILAFYGHPLSKRMGILGEYPKEELAKLLKGYTKLYDDANGRVGVIPAYYLIYGTCWPGGEIGYLKDSLVKDYIEYAASLGMLVFVDHQIGKYSVDDAVKRLLPFLKYPNVHLALDPEWRTTAPMEEIGSITSDEVNRAQAMISAYMEAQGIQGQRILVVHQFRSSMITARSKVRADFERVLLVHTADGFGPPALKRNTYALNATASNMPLKGFKLFFKTTVPGAGYDEPLLTPPEVLSLDPRPSLIIYQ